MENTVLSLQSKDAVRKYAKNNCYVKYEKEMIAQIQAIIEKGDNERLVWFNGFGDSLRSALR
jgi:hypothetical protein